jgi:hypothetical protein
MRDGSTAERPMIPAPTARPLPAGVRPPVRILPASGLLLGNGPTACTNQVPASGDGDRWCVFAVGEVGALNGELWVINVTRAMAGTLPRCDGTTSECLRLTTTLPMRTAARFDGDTLIYGANAVSGPDEDFLGPMYAWRPGWSRGRQISSDRGYACGGQRRSAAAVCFDDPAGDPAKPDSAAGRVGYLLDESGGPLPPIGRWPLRNANDTVWQSGFSPDGATFLLSGADSIGKKKTLRVLATSSAGQDAPMTVLDDVDYWTVSNDGRRIYFVRGLPQQADLFVADFPSGANPTRVEEGILSYELIGEGAEDGAIGFVKDLGPNTGSYRLLTPPGSAAKTIFDFEDILDGARLSLDLRYTVWLDFAFRGVVISNADLATCLLDVPGEPPVFQPAFFDHAGLMFWQELFVEDNSRSDAYYAPPADCRSKQFLARSIDFITPVGDRGVLFADEKDRMADVATLKYWAAGKDGASLDPEGPVRIQRGVRSPVAFVGESPHLVIFHVDDQDPDVAGTYIFGPVPF